jgi:hypothetical protein
MEKKLGKYPTTSSLKIKKFAINNVITSPKLAIKIASNKDNFNTT